MAKGLLTEKLVDKYCLYLLYTLQEGNLKVNAAEIPFRARELWNPTGKS